ncbi:hypothetical protein [Lentzea sp.]|uniref:hypothetical protein n=1 Tax=Lentzea sp. TaxID=56099 RepID=UPI002ED3F624
MLGNESTGEMNWEAFSHEELHRMLWQDADVADVSTVADEWARHRAALAAHGEVLREQRAALLDGWSGAAAEEAASRLAALAERVEKIGLMAAAGERAAQDSADALAAARAAMPAPPDVTSAAFAGFPAAFAPASISSFAPAPFALPSAPAPFALPAAPGFYFYFGAAAADQQKAQAVRAMQTYESSLTGSSRVNESATAPRTAAPRSAVSAPVRTPSSGGVPWQRLVGGSPPVSGSPVVGVSPQLTPGLRTGVMAVQAGSVAATGTLTADARAATQNTGMAASPSAGGRKDDDRHHENQMPTLDHDLFAVTERVSPAVIGEES